MSAETTTYPEKTLLLFIHGLGGKAKETWGMFPALLKQGDEQFAGKYEVDFFSYPTMLVRTILSRIAPSIQELASALRTQIDNRYGKFGNIILICHSLGGLIARRYLLDEIKANRPLRVGGVLLFAVPNNGAQLARVASFISWRHAQVRQLCRTADFLQDLNEDWATFELSKKLRIKFIVGTQDRVVDRQSAINGWGNRNVETIVGKGHRTIVKPNDADDLAIHIVKRFLNELTIAPSVKSQPEARDLQRDTAFPPKPTAIAPPQYWISDLQGDDPVKGLAAVEHIASNFDKFFPLLPAVFNSREGNAQCDWRLRKLFGQVGVPGIEFLFAILTSGEWWGMARAASCFQFMPRNSCEDRLADLISNETTPQDTRRRTIEALGWVGSVTRFPQIYEVVEDSFEKLAPHAFLAFATTLSLAKSPTYANSALKYLQHLLSDFKTEDPSFIRDMEWSWRTVTHRCTPSAEDALSLWLSEDDDLLGRLASIALSQSRNPRVLSSFRKAIQSSASNELLTNMVLYLGTLDTDAAMSAALELYDERPTSDLHGYGEWALSFMMHRSPPDRRNAIYRAIEGSRSSQMIARALYTLGPRPDLSDVAKSLLDLDDDEAGLVRAVAGLALAVEMGSAARSTLERIVQFARTPEEKALLLAGCMRTGSGNGDELHSSLAKIPVPPVHLEYLYRRELVFAVSRGIDGENRGRVWADLLDVDWYTTAEEISRFAPHPSLLG